MSAYRKLLYILIVVGLMIGCKGKKKPSLSGEDPVDVSDFIEFFQPLQLSYTINDSVLNKKEKDSLLISYKVFTQFVPDSVIGKVFGKGVKPKIYPLGRVEVSNVATFLFVKGVSNSKKATYILAFDKKNIFQSALTGLRNDITTPGSRTLSIDRRYTITWAISRKNKDGTTSDGRDVYSYSPESKQFTLVMTDALEDKATELINPIDTLARKHKWSADYVSGKMNMVSIRDGRKNDRLTFFIHFEKNNGECSGELKGEAIIKSNNSAEYHEDGDPCVLKFTFSSSSVTLNEQEGCGAHRGLRCSFNGSFPKKKYVKPVAKKSK